VIKQSRSAPAGGVARRGAARPRPQGTRKISVTVDAAVLDDVKRLLRRVGGNLSAHVSETLAQDLRHRRLLELIEEYEAEHGVITEAELAEVRAKWQG
jgi:hypothetical protein